MTIEQHENDSDQEFEAEVREKYSTEQPLLIHEDTLAIAALTGTVNIATVNKLIKEKLVVIQAKPIRKDSVDRRGQT